MSSASDFSKDVLANVEIATRKPQMQRVGLFKTIGGIQSFQEIAQVKRAIANLSSGNTLVGGEFAKISSKKIVPLEIDDTPEVLVISSNVMKNDATLASGSTKPLFQMYGNGQEVYYIELGEGNNDKNNSVSVLLAEDVEKDDPLKPASDNISVEIADTTDDVAFLKALESGKAGEVINAVRFYKVIS